ncbi:MAG: hypothetical protein JJ953_12525 [Gracilimonas sp.]|uniref:DUF6567 family protein n=2 Tax=Gracilimonas sp. TaxID=1974203 RepID=UPI001B00B440|nr:DUF6567 family protein [Gracilimonas sp.]MBO6586925.1 hypothetical protein [Gracilimonas sp.]MBO6614587.1 hypothetical protein [Gracilimonas sp.]
MMKSYTIIVLLTSVLVLAGCGNAGVFVASNNTQVELSEGNYSIVAKNVSGTSESAYILGASYSWGMATNAVGLIPIGDGKMLYKDAREDLWANFEAANSPVEGRKLALVNIQYDAGTTNLVLYTKAKVTITADVIEFD